MRATIKRAAGFDAMADNPATAMTALRREHVDRAFEAIVVMRNAIDDDLDRFVVFVAATFARRAAMPVALADRGFRLPVVAKIPARMSLLHA